MSKGGNSGSAIFAPRFCVKPLVSVLRFSNSFVSRLFGFRFMSSHHYAAITVAMRKVCIDADAKKSPQTASEKLLLQSKTVCRSKNHAFSSF